MPTPQDRITDAVRRGQDTVNSTVRIWSDGMQKLVSNMNLRSTVPTLEDLVDSSYAFAVQVLAMQRDFTKSLLAYAQPWTETISNAPRRFEQTVLRTERAAARRAEDIAKRAEVIAEKAEDIATDSEKTASRAQHSAAGHTRASTTQHATPGTTRASATQHPTPGTTRASSTQHSTSGNTRSGGSKK
jgi:hypothetical protein